ncbi:MAG TPA: DUF1659 domain-containing protein [Thermosynergistes sp.]|jgi:hypothetical protein|nr:DUF1659 domain-containing protein [Thermosynergistes sp.]
MAVYNPISSRLTLRLNMGTDTLGRPIVRSRSWSGIDPAATADDVVAVAGAIGSVLPYTVNEIQKVDTDEVA